MPCKLGHTSDPPPAIDVPELEVMNVQSKLHNMARQITCLPGQARIL